MLGETLVAEELVNHERSSPCHGVAVCRLLYRNRANSIESLGKGRGELFRHVLHDDQPRTIRRHALEELP